MSALVLMRYVSGVAGTLAGAVAGYLLYRLLASLGIDALVLPGIFVGLGCSLAARMRSKVFAVYCGVFAACWGVFCHWNVFPFVDDPGLTFFIQNLGSLPSISQVMLVIGTIAGAYIGYGNHYPAASQVLSISHQSKR